MAIRVDRAIFDAAGVGTESSGLRIYEDGTRNAPWQPAPFMSATEYAVSNALRWMAIPADVIRQQVPPPPAGGLFPQQFGYDTTPLTIDDVLNTDRWAPQRRSWISPSVVPAQRINPNEEMWDGSVRNALISTG